KKIDILEKNHKEYDKLLKKLQDILKPEDFTGKYLTSMVINEFEDMVGKKILEQDKEKNKKIQKNNPLSLFF
ncbi:MAG: hypothetical protein ACOC1P_04770, partial [Minisyncoccales bacterium]